MINTGFGPFRNYETNPSWEAVKLLQVEEVDLIKEQLEVAYDEVDEKIPQLWKQHNPDVSRQSNGHQLRPTELDSFLYPSS